MRNITENEEEGDSEGSEKKGTEDEVLPHRTRVRVSCCVSLSVGPAGANVTLVVTVTGGAGHRLRLVRDGAPGAFIAVPSDTWTLRHCCGAVPAGGARERWRAEVHAGAGLLSSPTTITSHVYLSATAATPR